MFTNPDILLVNPPYHRRVGSGTIPPIGLAYVAAACESEGMSVSIVDCTLDNGSQTPAGLKKFRTWLLDKLREIEVHKCIGVGPSTTPALKSLRVIAEVLESCYPGTPIVYGGPFASIPGQEPIFFDLLAATALVKGEGEQVFPELVRMIEKGDIGKAKEGVVWNPNSETVTAYNIDLDNICFPARHLLDNKLYHPSLRRDVFEGELVTAIYSSRGCPYKCLYCLSPMLRNHRIARRSAANVYQEMQQCIDSHGLKGFIFYDDCMFIKSPDINSRIEAFAEGLMKEVGSITWEMEIRCDAAAGLAPATLRALVSSGCAAINMGIEKGSNKGLATLRKQITLADVTTACSKINELAPEIRLTGTFILGGPAETLGDVNQTISLAKELPLDFAHFYPMEVYPGTELFNIPFAGMNLTAWAYDVIADDNNVCGELIFQNESISVSRLLELTQAAYKEFYHRDEWYERYHRRIAPTLSYDGLNIVDQWCNSRFAIGGKRD